jgi:transposase-like protein
MPENARLSGSIAQFDLDFVEREATPRLLMKLSIQLHLAGLSLSNTVSFLEIFGVQRARSTIHNWVHKADLQPTVGRKPNHVAIDETVIQLNNERYWLYAAVDPETNELLHIQLEPTTNSVLAQQFLAELRDKHLVDDAVFLVDSAPWLQAALHRDGLDYRYEKHGNRNIVERIFRELKRRTTSSRTVFSHAETNTVTNWLQTFAFAWNQLI